MESNFDGIAFRSVQREGGVNYVLFDNDAREATIAQRGRPNFDVTIATDAVSEHVVEGMHYRVRPRAG